MNACARKILPVVLGLCGTAANLTAQVTLTNLYSFGSSDGDGSRPEAALVQGRDGYFYGTTSAGGTDTNRQGTVFRISPAGSYSTICCLGGGDGFEPFAGLVQGRDGNFYGTASAGGTNIGGGTIFQASPDGSVTNLYSFSGSDGSNPGDGRSPVAGLVQGSDGNFYGTTEYGGTNGDGTVFQITMNGGVTILHSFSDIPDGRGPKARLVQGQDGNFYGTTYFGGTNGNGTVFQITTNGSLTILHSFPAFTDDGYWPGAGLVQGNDGNFYGTTYYGGSGIYGTVFQISPAGSYSNLYSFGSVANDGREPLAGLVQGSDGNFYGTTCYGGTNAFGTVFRISPAGSYSNLYSFGGTNHWLPMTDLVQGSDGCFYGTTYQGGTNAQGTVFKLTVPLDPPANQITALQVADTNVLVTIPSVAPQLYQLQYRTSLTAGAWADVAGAAATSIGGSLTVTNFGGFTPSPQFYRFIITP